MTEKARNLSWEQINIEALVREAMKERLEINDASTLPIVMLKFFLEDGKQSYIIGSEFFDALTGVDLKLESKYFPKDLGAVFLQFPKLIRLGHNQFTNGIFTRVFWEQDENESPLLMLAVLVSDRNGRVVRHKPFASSFFKIRPGILEEVFKTWTKKMYDQGKVPDLASKINDVIEMACKLLIYINSGDPDLRELRKPRGPGDRRAQVKEFGHYYSENVFHVGFEWKKRRVYSVDGTRVRGHWRWQPCGTGRQQVRLKFIEEHERHYGQKEGENSGV